MFHHTGSRAALFVLCAVVLLIPSIASAAAFTPGNIVVYRVGDGAAALAGTGTAVFLDEYTPAGVLVQSIAMPTTTSGAHRRLVSSGSRPGRASVFPWQARLLSNGPAR